MLTSKRYSMVLGLVHFLVLTAVTLLASDSLGCNQQLYEACISKCGSAAGHIADRTFCMTNCAKQYKCRGVCNDGVCTAACPPGRSNCNGFCKDLSTNYRNCGRCGKSCTGNKICQAGACVCPPATTDCGHRCSNLLNDSSDCGKCGNVCTGGKICDAGVCVCPSGLTDCNGLCVNVSNNAQNCGKCGNTCTGGKICDAGICVCPPGTTSCGGSCVNLSGDAQNCGQCGNSCMPGKICNGGACKCPAGQIDCGQCVNPSNDALNCGQCGKRCPSEQYCASGTCVCPGTKIYQNGRCVCPAGLSDCGGKCINLNTSASNCGACGRNCAFPGTCEGGTCKQPPPPTRPRACASYCGNCGPGEGCYRAPTWCTNPALPYGCFP